MNLAVSVGLKLQLARFNAQKKILENIHIIEDANLSAKESALKPLDIEEILKCPEGKLRNAKTGKCINQKNATKKEPRVQKDCPEGKVRNPTTGRCMNPKNSTKKEEPVVQKECPEGKVRNPKTGKCITPKNTTKKKTPVQKDCPEGKMRNPKTGRCIKIKV
jgi:hypothetical protein